MKFFYLFIFAAVPLFIFTSSALNKNFDSNNKLSDSTVTSSVDSLKISEDKKQRLTADKELYTAKCQRCHSLYNPAAFRVKKWVKNLNEMKHKAELTKEQYDMILEYLSENCKK